jgi:predicted ATP-grasp superfamily ATP-dependent carboligase
MMLYMYLLYSYGELVAYARTKRNKTYICKPTTGCQGRGIFVTKNVKEIKRHDKMVCQVYISHVSAIFLNMLYIKYCILNLQSI